MTVSLLPRGFALLWKTFWTGPIFSCFATPLRFRFVHEHLVMERTPTPVIHERWGPPPQLLGAGCVITRRTAGHGRRASLLV
ncbi:hypothetical protein DWW61_03965 [Limosilactobacillus fermentum]|nr:hypothetical protein DWW61_03965 [Limosilactobacillus fermentum]